MFSRMEPATHPSSVDLIHGTHFNPRSKLSVDVPGAGYLALGDYQASVSSMVGVIRVDNTRDSNAWERHDHGDELLILLAGSLTMTLRDAEGRTTEQSMSMGDVLIIPSGAAHRARLHTDEVQLLFVTPRTGTKEWLDV